MSAVVGVSGVVVKKCLLGADTLELAPPAMPTVWRQLVGELVCNLALAATSGIGQGGYVGLASAGDGMLRQACGTITDITWDDQKYLGHVPQLLRVFGLFFSVELMGYLTIV